MSEISEVSLFSEYFYEIYNSEEFLKSSSTIGQFMIVDCGCPRGLMGVKEYEKLKNKYEYELFKLKRKESFRFGPSKTYSSESKVRIPMMIKNSKFHIDFFLIEANIPILLGKDFLKPVGGSINIGEKQLEIKELNESIEMIETSGGHFVIPLEQIALLQPTEEELKAAREYHDNFVGEEADAIMIVLMAESEDENALKLFHDEVGHSVFLSIALAKDEKDQVEKVHRYFGHRSSKRIWDLFSKAKRLKGKRRQVIEDIDNCKVCSNHKKAPPRPRVGLPPTNDFNEVVGIDIKVLDKNKGEYILWMVDLFSKLIKGKYIRDKKPATVIQAIVDTWVVGNGVGPGHPTRGFWSDNGGSFSMRR